MPTALFQAVKVTNLLLGNLNADDVAGLYHRLPLATRVLAKSYQSLPLR